MRLEYYYYLIRLVDAGSLSKAAASLYVSPQGLSKAIQQMSAELGVPIFYRDKNGLHLTSAGNEVYKAAKQITAIHDSLKETLHPYANDALMSETIIYSSSHINVAFLHRALSKYYRKNPKAKIKLIELPPWEICKIRDVPDNAIRFFSLVEPTLDTFLDSLGSDYAFHELDRVPVLCRVSDQSPLAAQRKIYRNDLKEYSLALFSDEHEVVDTLFGPSASSKVGILVTNYPLLCELISNDKSLVGVTDLLIERNLRFPSVKAVPLEPTVYTVYGYIVRKDIQLSPTIVGLLEVICDELQTAKQSK